MVRKLYAKAIHHLGRIVHGDGEDRRCKRFKANEPFMQTNIDENVFELLVLLIEAYMELLNSHQIGKVV